MAPFDALTETLDSRVGLSRRLHRWLLDRTVPEHARRYYYCFGGVTFFLLLVQGITGVILTLYYVPSPERAYASVYYISHYVSYGWLIRSIHHWAAELMIVFVLLHMIRVFITGSYKPPRELNWVAGVLLLLVTLGFSLTGYLLPWDQKAYWGSAVTLALFKKVPLVGPFLSQVMMGGQTIGGATLTRFFSAHIMLLPAAVVVLLVAHFWMIRHQGISEGL